MTDPQTADALEAVAHLIAEGAPENWQQATLTATIGRNWTHGGIAQYDTEPAAYQDERSEELPDQLRRLHRALDADADDAILFDFVVHASGRYEAVTSESLEDLEPGYLYVLDRWDLPDAPGELQPGPVNAVPAGDPESAVELLRSYVGHVERILDRRPGDLMSLLPTPVGLEEEVGLPPDLLALYTVVNGDNGAGIFDNHLWFGLETAADPYLADRFWAERAWRTEVSGPTLLDCVPPLTVRRAADWPGWMPFATDMFGNYLAVDMAPGPRGKLGQVIRIGKDYRTGPVYVADSVTTLLRLHVEALERGDYKVADGNIRISWQDSDDGRDPRLLDLNGLAAPLQGVHEGIQNLQVKNAFQVDLEPVRGLPALWQVALTNCPSADLSPLQDTPVEELALALDVVDLTPLSGHPTLRRLTIRTRRPVDLSALRTLPALHSLDLSRAAVPDFGVLAELPALKYLSLRADQWAQATTPPNLAAAGLAGAPSLPEAVTWAARFSNHDPAHHTGTY